MEQPIFVSSFESMAAVDGPGVRFAIFLAGCPLRCVYCHNPETWTQEGAQRYTARQLEEKALRFQPYFAGGGGVTLSGGEPLAQAAALVPLVQKLQQNGIGVALDTAGSLYNDDVEALLRLRPMLLLDIKMPDEARFARYTGGHLATTLTVLRAAQRCGCDVWLRYVVVPGLNDADEDVLAVAALAGAHPCVSDVTLLAYHTLGVSKYETLGIPYPLQGVRPPTEAHMEHLRMVLQAARNVSERE